MKTIGLIGLLGLMFCGCDSGEREAAEKKARIENFAERMGLKEGIRLMEARRTLSLTDVENCRRRVARAADPNDLALAEDDLREARKELDRLESEIAENSRRVRELQRK